MASAAEQLARNLNFSTFAKAKALQQRIWFTLGALLVYRLGTYIPVPGIDPDAYAATFEQAQQGIAGMFDMFAGGAVQRMAIFALNLIPYITASIVVQVISTASPRLEALTQGRREPAAASSTSTPAIWRSCSAPSRPMASPSASRAARASCSIRAGSSASRPSSRWSAAPCS